MQLSSDSAQPYPSLSYSSPTTLTLAVPLAKSPTKGFSRRSHLPALSHSMWKIESGVVRTNTILDNGNTVTLGLWGPGDIVGKALSRVEPYEIECLTKVQAVLLPLEQCLCSSYLIPILQQAEELVVIRSYSRTEEQLSNLLVWLAKKFGYVVDAGNCIDLLLTHQDMADLLCSTRVTITRLFKQFEERGWIERQSVHQILLKEEDSWHYEI
jgi:CRP-like cAMP-binding protein